MQNIWSVVDLLRRNSEDRRKERRGRRRKQLLDNLKKTSEYWKLKAEALDRTLRRTRFGRSYVPVIRQTTEKKNGLSIIGKKHKYSL